MRNVQNLDSDELIRNICRKFHMANRRTTWLPGFSDRKLRFSWRSRRFLVLCVCSLFFIIAFQWLSTVQPSSPNLILHFPCRDSAEGYVLHEMGMCTDACGRLCFPRVHGLCFGHSEITICDHRPIPDDIKAGGGILPPLMRFYMEEPRTKVPVKHGTCPGWNSSAEKLEGLRWIHGLQMVADLTLMPTGRVGPNPHHESEKVVPAILFSRRYGLNNSTLYWFADPDDPRMISKWSLGLLEVFSNEMKVEYLRPAAKKGAPICFKDVILFTGVTNSGYIPNGGDHNWLRKRILDHCGIPHEEAKRPVEDVIAIHRPDSARNFANYEAVKDVIERQLRVSMKISMGRAREFCEQVRDIAQADVILTPHGSQNVNLVAMRPGAMVMEAFPYLYYIDWYGHYLHAGRVSHFELYGAPRDHGARMPLRSAVYSLVYGWQKCFFVKHCMNYGKSRQIYVDLSQLESLLQMLISDCRLIVKDSPCMQKLPPAE